LYLIKNHSAFANKFARETKVSESSIILENAKKMMTVTVLQRAEMTRTETFVYGWRVRSVTGSPTDFDAFAKYGASKSNPRSRTLSGFLPTPWPVAFYEKYEQTGVVLSLFRWNGPRKRCTND